MRRFLPVLVLSASVALAQQPGFHEEVEVRVMDLDVVVTDKAGRPVTDLKREDFTVKVGGKTVPIDYFARVEEGAIHAPDLATASPDQILTAYRQEDEAYVPRHFLIYVDTGHLAPDARKRGLEALRDLVTRLGPSDRARLVIFDRRTKPITEWSSSKEELLAAVQKIEHMRIGMSRLAAEQQAIHEIDYPAAIQPAQAQEFRESAAARFAEQQRAEIRQMLSDLRSELPTFAPLVGKKAFVFLSGGFEFQPGQAMTAYVSSRPAGFNQQRNPRAVRPSFITARSVPDVSKEIEDVVKAANALEITFYTLDARGLVVEGPTAGDDELLDSRLGFTALNGSQDGMVMLARETGGLALLNANDLRPGLQQVYQDGAVYYSLGVTLSKIASSGYQSVRVDVNRKGVTARARQGYAVRTPDERARDVVEAALKTNLAYTDIAVTLKTDPATKESGYYLLPISVALPSSGLTFIPEGEVDKASADVSIGVMDDSGRSSDVARQEATFTLPRGGQAQLVFTTKLKIRKGNQRIVVNLRDRPTGRMGTAKADVRVE
ncbi:MAG TPA: VWA domain-containing protein [Thermoanaerobaculia bacterium]|nr:VWA domain-containing protein [Thermoanaerobaculia bacterium]